MTLLEVVAIVVAPATILGGLWAAVQIWKHFSPHVRIEIECTDWRIPEEMLEKLAPSNFGPFQATRRIQHMIAVRLLNSTDGVLDGCTLKVPRGVLLAGIAKGDRTDQAEVSDQDIISIEDIKPKTSRQVILWTSSHPIKTLRESFEFRSKQAFRVRYDVIDLDRQRGKYRMILSTQDVFGWASLIMTTVMAMTSFYWIIFR